MNLKPTIKHLNPFAPEYNPIPPRVIPHPHAPLPSFLSLPSSSSGQPPPLPPPPPPLQPPLRFLPNHFLTYIPSISHYTHYATSTQNPLPPPPPPPPSPPWIGSGRHRRWLPGDCSRRGFKFDKMRNNCNGKKRAVRVSKDVIRSMQKVGKRNDEVMPLKRDEEKTTVMIKNIPYDCTRGEVISVIDRFCFVENAKARNASTSQGAKKNFTSAYDFLYLPIDFGTNKSRGFAFVNFTNATAVWKFFEAFHQKNWNSIHRPTNWTKKIEVVAAKIQGKKALVNHFSKSIFECQTNGFLPVTFDPPRNGSGQSVQLTSIGMHRAKVSTSNFHWEARSNHKPSTLVRVYRS